MPKKITMRDIAREAGVSVATVSYIMNNRTDQKISEATRKKVLQLANLLDYTPNSAAKSLATGKGNIIGIIGCRRDDAPCRALEDAYFTDLLMRRLNRLGYDALTAPFSPGSDLPAFHRDVDAVITIDLPHRDFVELADNCYVPVINVDMLINDSLFYQIYSDFPRLISEAEEILGKDFLLVWEEPSNENYRDFIAAAVPEEKRVNLPLSPGRSLRELSGRSLLALGNWLGVYLRAAAPDSPLAVIASDNPGPLLPADIPVIINDVTRKANVTINILLNALDKKFDITHNCKI